MFIIRGKKEQKIFEDFDKLQHYAYCHMSPLRLDGTDSVFELVGYYPGGHAKCEAVFYRGCNGLAMPSKFVALMDEMKAW
jgi:hypothetical protein